MNQSLLSLILLEKIPWVCTPLPKILKERTNTLTNTTHSCLITAHKHELITAQINSLEPNLERVVPVELGEEYVAVPLD